MHVPVMFAFLISVYQKLLLVILRVAIPEDVTLMLTLAPVLDTNVRPMHRTCVPVTTNTLIIPPAVRRVALRPARYLVGTRQQLLTLVTVPSVRPRTPIIVARVSSPRILATALLLSSRRRRPSFLQLRIRFKLLKVLPLRGVPMTRVIFIRYSLMEYHIFSRAVQSTIIPLGAVLWSLSVLV